MRFWNSSTCNGAGWTRTNRSAVYRRIPSCGEIFGENSRTDVSGYTVVIITGPAVLCTERAGDRHFLRFRFDFVNNSVKDVQIIVFHLWPSDSNVRRKRGRRSFESRPPLPIVHGYKKEYRRRMKKRTFWEKKMKTDTYAVCAIMKKVKSQATLQFFFCY